MNGCIELLLLLKQCNTIFFWINIVALHLIRISVEMSPKHRFIQIDRKPFVESSFWYSLMKGIKNPFDWQYTSRDVRS